MHFTRLPGLTWKGRDAMPDPLATISTRVTPQNEAADPAQVLNSAGGYTFTVDADARLHRFLTLGTDGGTYYASEHELTKANAGVVLDRARSDAAGLAERAAAISEAGRAPRNNPALFALAAAASLGDAAGRKAALAALPRVARTGTHLFTFAKYLEQFRGWGKGARKAVGGWYLAKEPAALAYQVCKYRQRDGWAHRDLLRSAHPFTPELNQPMPTPAQRRLFDWLCGREADLSELPLVQAFIQAQSATKDSEWAELIMAYRLSWEMLPGVALTRPAVWEALIESGLPQTALIRQLPRLTHLGVLAPLSAVTVKVAAQLADPDRLIPARVHPVNVLVALRTYASGHAMRGDSTWQPVAKITDALDAAFYAAFGAVEPAGKRTMLALDVSGSMTGPVSGLPISCREASAALALVTAATEPQTVIIGFTSQFGRLGRGGYSPLDISPRRRLDDAIRAVSDLPFGGTDCSLPMLAALSNHLDIDHFSVYTDSETWAGAMHPHQALTRYRQKTGINARLSVVGMTATDFTIADPADPGSMDVAGFDSAVPTLLADFARGEFGSVREPGSKSTVPEGYNDYFGTP